MTTVSQYEDEPLLDLCGRPGDLVRIIPKSDPKTWYEGRILAVYADADGLPLAYRLKPIANPQGVVQESIPWSAIESVNFIEFATEEPQP